MTRILFALILMASQASAQALSLDSISQYFNSFATAQGKFTQVNPDGTISTGTIYIKRPGRVRFDYNPPNEALVIAGGGAVAIFDPKSSAGRERYPLAQTPLKIILERRVNLARQGMVTGHSSDGTRTSVTAQDPERPELGSIKLVFTGAPTELRQWILTDDVGQQTTVILGDLTKGGAISDRKFNIQAEERARGIE